MIVEQFFPTLIYGKDVNLDNNLFAREVIEWSKRDPGETRTNMNGWHSTTNMHQYQYSNLWLMNYLKCNKKYMNKNG